MVNKYKILVDTNFIRKNEGVLNEAINNNLNDLLDFIKDHDLGDKVTLAIPEAVIEERVTQMTEEVKKLTSSIDTSFKKLSVFGVEEVNAHKIDYRKILKDTFLDKLKGLKLEIVAIPEIEHRKILERALNRIKPFSAGDKGYKDTLIWLSLIEDAKKNNDCHFIFATNNKGDFDLSLLEPEFKEISNKKIVIISSPQEIKEFFDKEFKLSLDLKERNRKIIDDIKKDHLGEIMSFLHTNISSSNNQMGVVFATAPTIYRADLIGNQKELISYTYQDIKVQNISGDEPIYHIEADVIVRPNYKNENKGFDMTYAITPQPMFFNSSESISIRITYDSKNKTIDIQNVFGIWGRNTWDNAIWGI